MKRMLGYRRLSRDDDASTSLERQDERLRLRAAERGDEVVEVVTDRSISGAMPPLDRPGLGPWLTDPALVARWDVLCVVKLDRLTRSVRDFDALHEWCEAHGKTIISLDESLDLSTSTGRMFAGLLSMFAQFERERIGERRAEAAAKLWSIGKWGGGKPPYGYRPDNGKLVIDTHEQAIVTDIAHRIIGCDSINHVCQILNQHKEPAPQRGQWTRTALTRILRRETLLGYNVTKRGRLVTDDAGHPIQFREPVISPELFADLQTALDDIRTGPVVRRYDAAMLTGVAYCLTCSREGRGDVRLRSDVSGDGAHYYRCQNRENGCHARSIPMDYLNAAIDDQVISLYGSLPDLERKITRGTSNARALNEVERAIKNLDLDDLKYAERHSALMKERAEIKAMPATPSKDERKPTGLTVAQKWAGLSDGGKRGYLATRKWRVFTERQDTGRKEPFAVTVVEGGELEGDAVAAMDL